MKLIKKLIHFSFLFGLCVFIFCQFLNSEKKGSIFGIIKAGKTNIGIPNAEVMLEKDSSKDLSFKKTTVTDREGKYSFDSLDPAIYWIHIIPNLMYCRGIDQFELKKGEDYQCNIELERAGFLKGKVYTKKDLELTPIANAKINLICYPYYEETTSDTNGNYILGRINPKCDYGYKLNVDSKIKNMAYKVKDKVRIIEGMEENEDIVFDLDDSTQIEGIIKSSIDGGPIQYVRVYFTNYYGGTTFAKAISDQNGYFVIHNLEEMNYKVYFDLFSHPQTKYKFGEIEQDIYIKKNKKNKVEVNIDVESSFIRGEEQ